MPSLREKHERFTEGLGGRKTSLARVRVFEKAGTITVNGKDYLHYFKTPKLQATVRAPLELTKLVGKVTVTALVRGGGTTGQAEAVRHGIARALTGFHLELKKPLRHAGFMTRDARVVERKKYGLKKARRAPQWQKR